MKILLFLMMCFIVQMVSAQTDTIVAKKKILTDSSNSLHSVFYPQIASTKITRNNTPSRTYLYWDPNMQMLIKKPYKSHYKDSKLLDPAQAILSFVIPNNVGKP